MDSFFDTSLGSGTAAPRKRAPYASKRLQKVVLDYRKEKQRRSQAEGGTANEGAASTTSEEDGDTAAVASKVLKGKGKTKAVKSTAGSSEASSEGMKSTGKKRKAPTKKAATSTKKKRKAVAIPSDSESVEDEAGSSNVPDRPLEAKLRRRPKPVYAIAQEDEDEEMV